jgi:hypothetical protein
MGKLMPKLPSPLMRMKPITISKGWRTCKKNIRKERKPSI